MSFPRNILMSRFPQKKHEVHQLLRVLSESNLPESVQIEFCKSDIVTESFWVKFSELYDPQTRGPAIMFVRNLAELRLQKIPVKQGGARSLWPQPFSWTKWLSSFFS